MERSREAEPPKQKPTVKRAGADSGGSGSVGLEIGYGGLHVFKETTELDLLDVRHVLEQFVAGGETGGASEVVNAEGVDTLFGEAKSQLFVEVVEAAHVGADDDAWRVAAGWAGCAKYAEKGVPLGR